MVDIPNSLRTVFSAALSERDGVYVVEVPPQEIDRDTVTPRETYRVAILESPSITERGGRESRHRTRAPSDHLQEPPEPPVEEGEIRDVTIVAIGDQGDGIAKVDRGYVVIVPGVQPGDEPTVEIEKVQQNVAFARVLEPDYVR